MTTGARPAAPSGIQSPVDLQGRVAVITGSTSGIGLALARAVAERGGDVVLNGRREPSEVEAMRAGIEAGTGVRVRYRRADMREPDEIAGLIETTRAELGRIDILVNNAGVQHVEAIERFPAEAWERIIAVNLSSAFHATKAVVPIMKAQGRGRIVNIASAHGLVASPFKSAYVAAKHGLIGLTKTVALEVARDGITCNAISPGFVETPLVQRQIAELAAAHGIPEDRVVEEIVLAKQPTKRFVTTEEVSGLFLYLVSDLGASANGASFSLDGGWTAE